MFYKDIRLSSDDRRMIFNIKNTTGIEHFYVICRWAFCLSLDSDNRLKKLNATADGAVEFSWDRFGGEEAEIYYLILKDEAQRLEMKVDDDSLYELLISHIRRGLGYLTGNKELKTLEGLSSRAFRLKQLELIK